MFQGIIKWQVEMSFLCKEPSETFLCRGLNLADFTPTDNLKQKQANVLRNVFLYCQGENPFTGNKDDQAPEDSMVMDVSELELTSETADNQTDANADAPVKDEPVAEGETGQEAVEGEAAAAAAAVAAVEEEKMEEEPGMEGEEGEEEQENHEEEEGFEVGEEEEEEEGYVVRDEINEEGLQAELDEEEEEEEGVEVAEAEEEDKNDEWLLHPRVCDTSSITSVRTSQWPPQSHEPLFHFQAN